MHGEAFLEILKLVTASRLKVLVDRTFPMADVAKAHTHLHSRRAIGKVVLRGQASQSIQSL
jgi:NADPH:quinone reductase-like Zn-dependent oxidoreductase